MKKFTKLLVSGLCVVSTLSLSSCTIIDKIKVFFTEEEPPITATTIFDGNYQKVEVGEVEGFFEKDSKTLYREIFLYNQSIVAESVYKSNGEVEESSGGEIIRKYHEESESSYNLEVSREGKEITSPYKAKITKTEKESQDKVVVTDDKIFTYVDGAYKYTEENGTKLKTSLIRSYSEFFLNDLPAGLSVYNMEDFEKIGVLSDAVWSMDTTDETYSKVKISTKIPRGIEANVTITKEKFECVWIYNKSNQCVAFSIVMEIEAVESEGGKSSYLYDSVYVKPWEGTVETPTDLNTYLTQE